jgi:hypothetical protein
MRYRERCPLDAALYFPLLFLSKSDDLLSAACRLIHHTPRRLASGIGVNKVHTAAALSQ